MPAPDRQLHRVDRAEEQPVGATPVHSVAVLQGVRAQDAFAHMEAAAVADLEEKEEQDEEARYEREDRQEKGCRWNSGKHRLVVVGG